MTEEDDDFPFDAPLDEDAEDTDPCPWCGKFDTLAPAPVVIFKCTACGWTYGG
jgi:ribosomal protein L37AE/L43A